MRMSSWTRREDTTNLLDADGSFADWDTVLEHAKNHLNGTIRFRVGTLDQIFSGLWLRMINLYTDTEANSSCPTDILDRNITAL